MMDNVDCRSEPASAGSGPVRDRSAVPGTGAQGTNPAGDVLKLLSRRQFAQRVGGSVVASSALASLLAACGDEGESDTGDGSIGGTLDIYVWEGYYNREAAAPFVNKYDVAVKTSAIANNEEVLTKLKAGGSRVDLVSPNVGQAVQLASADVLQPLDLERIPNAQHYLPQISEFSDDVTVDGDHYITPYLWGLAGCVYDSAVIPTPPQSWMDFTRAEYADRLAVFDSALDNYYTWAPTLGYDALHMTQEQLDDVTNFLIEFKRTQVRTFTSSFDDMADQLGRGDIAAIGTQMWIVLAGLAAEKGGKSVTWNLPKKPEKGGGVIWTDGLAIPSDASNVDTAYAFLNYMIGADAQAIIAPALSSATVNAQAVSRLPRTARTMYPYDGGGELEKYTTTFQFPTGENGEASYEDLVRAWAQVQAA
jgi:spermidine/putrescine transport system substrate-binding protein